MNKSANRDNQNFSDESIVRVIQSGAADRSMLFGELVKRHQDAIRRRCLAYLRHPEDAADAAQETLFRAYRAIERFNGGAAFRTWLFAIADNQCHSQARRRRRHAFDEPFEDAAIDRLADDRHALHEHDDSTREEVHRALAQVTPLGRDVLHLRYFGDLSIEEIANTLGVGISAAKMRLYRAQEQVAHQMSGHMESWCCAA